MGYNHSQVIEVELTGTHLEDRTNLNLLYTRLLEKYGFTRSGPEISYLAHRNGSMVTFKKSGERVLRAIIIAKEPSVDETHKSLIDLIEETNLRKQNGH